MSTDKIETLDQALAEIFNESHLISTKTEPNLPDVDREALAGIFSEPLPIFNSAEPSPPHFDYQLLAEMFSGPPPVLIDLQRSPLNIDEVSSPPLFGDPDNKQPAANIVEECPSSSAENERSQRTESLLAKIRHIFSTKAETLPSSTDNGSSSVSSPGQLRETKPVAKAIAPAPQTNAAIERLRRVTPLLVETTSPVSTDIEPPPAHLVPSCPPATGGPDDVTPGEHAPTVAARADEQRTQQKPEALPNELRGLVLRSPEPPPPVAENGRPRQTLSDELTEFELTVKAVDALLQADAVQPHNARSLVIAPLPPPSTTEPSLRSLAPGRLNEVQPLETLPPPFFATGPARQVLSGRLDEPVTRSNADLTLPIREKEPSGPRRPSSLSSQPKHGASIAETVEGIPSANEGGETQEHRVSLPNELEPSQGHPPTTLSGGSVDIAPEVKTLPPAPRAHAVLTPQQTKSLPLSSPPLPLPHTSDSCVMCKEEQPPPVLTDQPVTVAPALQAAAAPADLQGARPWQAKSLQAKAVLDISREHQTSLEEVPSRPIFHDRRNDIEPDVKAAAIDCAPSMGDVTQEKAKPLLAGLELDTAIRLRWVMRDIRANRTAMSPTSENDLATLVELGLIEMRGKLPGLTHLGVLELN
jgi:hypothetical protein